MKEVAQASLSGPGKALLCVHVRRQIWLTSADGFALGDTNDSTLQRFNPSVVHRLTYTTTRTRYGEQ